MTLHTQRLPAPSDSALALEVAEELAPASALLWYLERRLPGLRVVAKKSWALTDDFEAYFLYRERLYLMQTPMVDVWILQFGALPDEQGFSEVEATVQAFSPRAFTLALIPIAKYFFLPFNPGRALLHRHGASMPTPDSESGKRAA